MSSRGCFWNSPWKWNYSRHLRFLRIIRIRLLPASLPFPPTFPTSTATGIMSDSSLAGVTIPQIAAAAIIGYFVLRWVFKPSSPNGNTTTAATPRPRNPNEQRRLRQQVEVLKGMFPQFSEAAIEAELLRNGMSIEIATDRILTTGFLPEVSDEGDKELYG